MPESNEPTENFLVDIREVSSVLYKTDAEEFESALNDDSGEFNPIEFLKTKQTSFVDKFKDAGASQYSRGLKEASTKKEREFLEAFGIEFTGQKGDQAISAVKEFIENQKGSDKTDEWKEKYNTLKVEHSNILKTKDEEIEKSISEIKSKYDQEHKQSKLKEIATSKFLSNPNISWSDDKDANAFKTNLFFEKLMQLPVKFEDGKPKLLDSDGSILTNSLGHEVSFEDEGNNLLKNIIGINKAKPRQPSGISQGQTTFSGQVPASLEELNKRVEELGGINSKEAQELSRAFIQQNK